MLSAAYNLLRESGRVFLEAAPRGLDPQAIGHRMASLDGVTEVHDLANGHGGEAPRGSVDPG